MLPGPDSDSMGAPPGFAARRPNAPSLPNFELPPPIANGQQKYAYAHGYTQAQQAPGSLASVGNLLTPPSTVGGDGVSPASAGILSANSASSVPPQTPNGGYAWSPAPAQGNTPYGFQPAANPSGQRVPFSPLNTAVQGGQSQQSSSSEGQMASAYPVNLPPFPSSAPMSAPATLPTMGQHHQQAPQSQASGHGMMSAPAPVSTAAPQPSPVQAHDGFRPPPTPTYYSQQPTNAPQQSPFPYSAGPSSTQASPLSAGPMSARPHMSPATTGPTPPLSAPPVQSPHAYQGRFPPYAPPHGPVLSNINNPNGQPMLLGGLPHSMMHGGFNSGHAANLQHMYGTPHNQTPPHNDRPFKCDQCPQSFNRNHDLKRHKRIHLAVKPFPCGHCDKSFSRKDALKRHILVKGCGKAQQNAEAEKQDGSASPDNKTAISEPSDVKPVSTHS